MKLRRILSCMMALLLVCSLPLTAFAAEYDLAQGSVTVNATETGQTVTHGTNEAVADDAPVITQSNNETPTTNTITITAAADTTANVTLSGVNINTSGAAVEIKGNGNVVIELDGSNTVQSGNFHAGVEKNTIVPTGSNPGSGNGNLTITDENETTGSLKATGGSDGSGIGGCIGGSGSNITITGSAEVNATGGSSGAGIGGGWKGSGSGITIEGSAEVTAKGGNFGAGIGGGSLGSGSDITISGSAEVTAKGGGSGAGIGGGYRAGGNAAGSNITVSEDAQVKAQGGNSGKMDVQYFGAGAAIGDGGESNYRAEANPGDDVAPKTDALNEGWIATYAPGEDMQSNTPDSLTYKDTNGTVQTATQNITIEAAEPATSDTHGHEAGFKVGNSEVVAVTIHNYGNYQSDNNATCTHDGTESAKCTVPGCTAKLERTILGSMKQHEFVNYVPDTGNPATCTTDGTKTATCNNCTATDTITDPAKGHSFNNYISDNNATYEQDGTKTAKCDHPGCDATDTITDPGTRLPAPLYRVIGEDGQGVSCETERTDGVLTIAVEEDSASLTGYLGGLQGLRAQGIDTIVFVTNGATSTFALADLMAAMTAGDSYTLTHDGSTVTFTLATGTDISGILK